MDDLNIMPEAFDRFKMNLLFFKKAFPDIYRRFQYCAQDPAQLVAAIDRADAHFASFSEENNGDLYAKRAMQFLEKTAPPNTVMTMDPPFSGDFLDKRFFGRQVVELLRRSELSRERYKRGFFYEGHIPHLVIFGVYATGYIEQVLSERPVNAILFYELDPDLFIASLTRLDWTSLCQPFLNDRRRHITFIIGDGDKVDTSAYERMLYLYLLEQCPTYPLLTLCCNPTHAPVYARLIDSTKSMAPACMSSWGHYDDELYQLNQAKHNVMGCDGAISWWQPESNPVEPQTLPICLVGAGPSLDRRIDELRMMAPHAVVVSCGSAITALHKYGVVPDIHVESESDYGITMGYLAALKDETYLRSITLLAPLHMNPWVVRQFGAHFFYLKAGCSVSDLFSEIEEPIQYSAPTCLNAAFALTMVMRFNKVYLFGTDLGFYSENQHHSTASIYYEPEAQECFKEAVDYSDQCLVTVPSVTGERLFTSAFYLLTKIKLEEAVSEYVRRGQVRREKAHEPNVYNCSDGAQINGTEWLSKASLIAAQKGADGLDAMSGDKQAWLQGFHALEQHPSRTAVIKRVYSSRIAQLHQGLKSMQHDIALLLHHRHNNNRESLHLTVISLQHYLESVVRPQRPTLYTLMRGVVWHFGYVVLSHSYSAQMSETGFHAFVKAWVDSMIRFFSTVADHFESVMNRTVAVEEDPWLKQSITDLEVLSLQG